MPEENTESEEKSEEKQHLKFNQDVLPEFKRREDAWETGSGEKLGKMLEEETDSILKWVGLAILLLVIGGVVGVTLYQRGDRGEAEKTEPSAAEEAGREREIVKGIVKAYMGSKDIPERLKHVRRPETVKPLMEDYYTENLLYPLKVWNYEQVEPRSIDGWQFWYAVVNTPEGREIVLLEKIGDSFKVDWETHVGLNPMLPEDYVDERPSGKLDFRVYVTPDSYFNAPFADTEKYLSAKLEFANSGVVIFGYLERTSPDLTRFLELTDGQKQAPLILKLEWPEGELGERGRLPQVHIRKLVSERWLVID